MKQTVLSRVRQAEKATKPRKKIYFGRGSLTQTENGYDLFINVSEKWFNGKVIDIIEKHFDTYEDAEVFLDERQRNGCLDIIGVHNLADLERGRI